MYTHSLYKRITHWGLGSLTLFAKNKLIWSTFHSIYSMWKHQINSLLFKHSFIQSSSLYLVLCISGAWHQQGSIHRLVHTFVHILVYTKRQFRVANPPTSMFRNWKETWEPRRTLCERVKNLSTTQTVTWDGDGTGDLLVVRQQDFLYHHHVTWIIKYEIFTLLNFLN